MHFFAHKYICDTIILNIHKNNLGRTIYQMKLNPNYANLKDSYLFVDIARRVAAYTKENPDADIIRLGIGDCTRPLPAPIVQAMKDAADEQGDAKTFHGYGPEQGYEFLRSAIAGYYAKWGVKLDASEVFVSEGAKSDCGNILEIFSADNTVLVPDPVYPVYVDANVMDGRRIIYMEGNSENNFLPMPNKSVKADIIYLCSPNNPTGAAYTRQQLAEWVEYACENDAVILFDAAYESFAQTEGVPHSIYEVAGAEKCAIEICSLSKTAGFTGTRCSYTIVPNALNAGDVNLNRMWNRRQTTKFNEVSYVVQRGAEAVFTDEGMAACMENVAYYKNNAAAISAALTEIGVWHCGGKDSPYIWLKCPSGMDSWSFFDLLLNKAGVVGTPGAGFGKNGEGYFRLTGFGDAGRTKEAIERVKKLFASL